MTLQIGVEVAIMPTDALSLTIECLAHYVSCSNYLEQDDFPLLVSLMLYFIALLVMRRAYLSSINLGILVSKSFIQGSLQLPYAKQILPRCLPSSYTPLHVLYTHKKRELPLTIQMAFQHSRYPILREQQSPRMASSL